MSLPTPPNLDAMLESATPEQRRDLIDRLNGMSSVARSMFVLEMIEAVTERLTHMKLETQVEACCEIMHRSRLEIVDEPK